MNAERNLDDFSDVESSVEIVPGYAVKISPRRIKELELQLRAGLATWLMGLDEQARLLVWSLFMLISYTDKLTNRKLLGQPNVMFDGGTGVGKTDLIETLAMLIDAVSSRIQGTPDIQPWQITGGPTIVETKTGREIRFKPGKVFAHILRVDEGNRMRGQSASALIEPMEERSVTPSTEFVGNDNQKMDAIPLFPISGDYTDLISPRFFTVWLTQNIFGEEEGTNPNPRAILDRITLTIRMKRPKLEDEARINAENVIGKTVKKVSNLKEILAGAHYIIQNVASSDKANLYRAQLLRNTDPETVSGSKNFVNFVREHVRIEGGASPRVNFHLQAAARVEAFFRGFKEIRPEHIKAVAGNVITHRLLLTAGKEFNTTKEEVFQEILKNTEMPPWR